MPRQSRKFSITNIYHIILRGNDRQDIFYDNQDRHAFLDKIKKTKKIYNYEIYAYCLMSNHVHIVIKIEDEFLSKSMQNLALRYSTYFNKKTSRSGHLFESRFFSKKIENLDYFLTVCKYIHRNPEKAQIEKTDKYEWSSFSDYVNFNKEGKDKNDFVNTKVLMHYYNNDLNNFINNTLNSDDKETLNEFVEYEILSKLSEEELANIIVKKFGIEKASDVSISSQKNEMIKEIKNISGTSVNQISRVTRVSRYYIKKIWKVK